MVFEIHGGTSAAKPQPLAAAGVPLQAAPRQARSCIAQAEAKSSKSFLVLFFKKEQR
jgi:hypothetical protein